MITAPARRLAPARSFRRGEGWVLLWELRGTRGAGRFDRSITVFRERDDGAWRRSTETHRVRVLDRAAVASALRAAGYTVRTQASWGPDAALPGQTLFVARRRP